MVLNVGVAEKVQDDGAPRRGTKRALVVAHQIVNEIGQGNLKVGDKLPSEQDMLIRYGVARATLREALRFLELQGVIHLKSGPGGGPVLRVPKPDNFASTMALLLQFVGADFRALIEVRQAIGPGMAAHAAERATENDINRLRCSLDRLRSLEGTSSDYVEENRRFHDLLAWASRNPLIGFLVVALHQITNASGIGIAYSESERNYQMKAYERIFSAIEGRNPEMASTEMLRFMRRSDNYMEKRYPDLMSKCVRWDDAAAIVRDTRPSTDPSTELTVGTMSSFER